MVGSWGDWVCGEKENLLRSPVSVLSSHSSEGAQQWGYHLSFELVHSSHLSESLPHFCCGVGRPNPGGPARSLRKSRLKNGSINSSSASSRTLKKNLLRRDLR